MAAGTRTALQPLLTDEIERPDLLLGCVVGGWVGVVCWVCLGVGRVGRTIASASSAVGGLGLHRQNKEAAMPAEANAQKPRKTIEDYVGEQGNLAEGWACARCKATTVREPMPQLKPVWIQDLTMQVRTGDVVLFSSKHSASNLTKMFTNSAWDHCGVIVKPTPRQAYLVEWGGGLFASELVRARARARTIEGSITTPRPPPPRARRSSASSSTTSATRARSASAS